MDEEAPSRIIEDDPSYASLVWRARSPFAESFVSAGDRSDWGQWVMGCDAEGCVYCAREAVAVDRSCWVERLESLTSADAVVGFWGDWGGGGFT